VVELLAQEVNTVEGLYHHKKSENDRDRKMENILVLSGIRTIIPVCVCVWGGSYNSVTVAENIFIEFYIGGPY